MGYRQDMTPEQLLKWDSDNYRKRLEANKGSNYQYWTEKHDKLLENGWSLYEFRVKDQRIDFAIMFETLAKETVKELRTKGNYARIVCGYEQNRQRTKMYSVIFKPKKK